MSAPPPANETAGAPPGEMGPPAWLLAGKPYPVLTSVLGGIPNKEADLAHMIYLMIAFCVGVLWHGYLLAKKQNRMWFPAGILFSLPFLRMLALALRFSWMDNTGDNQVAIAALVLAAANTVGIVVNNLCLAYEILYAYRPDIRHVVRKYFRTGMIFFAFLLFAVPAANTIAIVQTFYTTDMAYIKRCIKVIHASTTWETISCAVPPAVILFAVLTSKITPTYHGKGTIKENVVLVLVLNALIQITQLFKGVSGWYSGTLESPPWWHNKGFFYGIMWIDIVILYTYLATRWDLRFNPRWTGARDTEQEQEQGMRQAEIEKDGVTVEEYNSSGRSNGSTKA